MSKDEINAFLGASTEYSGKLSFQGAVRIDGTFYGEIESDGALVAGKDCHIEADINVGEFILSGNYKGKAIVKKRTTIHKTGQFEGELYSPALIVEEGASLEGVVTMKKPMPTLSKEENLKEENLKEENLEHLDSKLEEEINQRLD